MKNQLFLIATFLISSFHIQAQSAYKTLLFIGSYTDEKPDKGIYIYEFDENTGTLKALANGNQITNPSYLNISPNGKFLYANTETRTPYSGSISAFNIDSLSGQISPINMKFSGGANPVYLDIYSSGRYLVNANYTGGSVSLFEINTDGSLNNYQFLYQFKDSSIIKKRQESSHIHSANFSPDFKYVYLPDLGADKIRVFEFHPDSNVQLFENKQLEVKTKPGSGPRHFTFHPSGKFAYCIEELSGTVCVYSYLHGKLSEIQSVKSYSKTQETYGSADIHISDDGRFLYASNRWDNENTISVFKVITDGKLQLIQHQKTGGDHPRNFTLDPSGQFLLVANLISNNIVVFRRDIKTGLLSSTKNEIKIPSPSCLKMRRYIKHSTQ
ncbi:MAG: lactonase family protein [Bacteroidia bacterium]